ncbi:MAG: ROK family transcriptional regulator [Acidobacteriaceae bacterium]
MKNETIALGRPSLLRHTNALTILALLRKAGSCSKADLVRASGLSAPTVTNVVGDLLAANLIKPLGEGESSGGRPPDMISFKAGRGCILSVQISTDHLSYLLTDLSGTELEMVQIPLDRKMTTPEAICDAIGQEIRRLLKKHRKSREQLLALVVGVPAITNVEEGIVLSISTFRDWRSVPLRALLSKVVECEVLLENDTNLSALGEYFCGAARNSDTFVCVNIGDNVSAGIVLNGKIHHGSQWAAGEIAYMQLPNIARRHPALYEFGELETVLAKSGILKHWMQLSGKSGRNAKRRADLTTLFDLARTGDALARKILQRRAVIVADIIVNLSLILNPGLILLGGEVGSHSVLLDHVQRQLKKCEFAIPKVTAASLGDAAVLWGGIALAVDRIPAILLPPPVG